MPILNIQISQTGLAGVYPRVIYINTNNTESEILATGYLNQSVENGFSFTNFDMACVSTAPSQDSLAVSTGWFNISNVGTNWSLVPAVNPGSVILPTKTGHIATYNDVNGALTEDATIAINGGTIQAGLSGTAGTFRSYPAAASKGYLSLTAVANTGNTATTISNAAMGQQSTISIPDPGNSTANFLVAATNTPFVSGNFTKASGTTGLIIDAGAAIRSGVTSTYAGGSTSNAFTVSGMTASWIVTAVNLTSTSSVSITKAVPSANTLTINWSADPGAGTTVNWIATTASA